MRNSHVDIRRNGPDTSELDVGWDFEPDSVELPTAPVDSLLPSHSSIRPSHTALRRSSEVPARRAAPARNVTPRLLIPAALIVLAGTGAGALATFGRSRQLPPTPATFAAEPDVHEVAPAAPVAPPAPPLLAPPQQAVDAPQASTEAQLPDPAQPRRVLVQVDPPAASVFVHGKRLGNDFVSVELNPGRRERATITLPGYVSRIVELDGNSDLIHVTLVRIPRSQTRAAAAGPAALPDEHSDGAADTTHGEADVAYPE